MITVNLYYKGKNGSARAFAEEMEKCGMMKQLALLREKYDLHMTVERFVSDEYDADKQFIRM